MTEITTAAVFALRREAVTPRRVAPIAREPARKPRRYPLTPRLESFLRTKYLEHPVSPAALPDGTPLVFPLTPNTRALAGGGGGSDRNSATHLLRNTVRLVALALTLLLFGAIAFKGQAHAGEIQFDTSAFVGETATQYSFNVSSAGSLNLSLLDYHWPTSPLTGLMLEIESPTSILGQWNGAGMQTLSLSGPGTYYALVTGTTAGPSVMGAYGLEIDFQAAGPTPVPLPASISLLLGGFIALLWSARRGAVSFTRHAPQLAC
jgi:hypothetical protein